MFVFELNSSCGCLSQVNSFCVNSKVFKCYRYFLSSSKVFLFCASVLFICSSRLTYKSLVYFWINVFVENGSIPILFFVYSLITSNYGLSGGFNFCIFYFLNFSLNLYFLLVLNKNYFGIFLKFYFLMGMISAEELETNPVY